MKRKLFCLLMVCGLTVCSMNSSYVSAIGDEQQQTSSANSQSEDTDNQERQDTTNNQERRQDQRSQMCTIHRSFGGHIHEQTQCMLPARSDYAPQEQQNEASRTNAVSTPQIKNQQNEPEEFTVNGNITFKSEAGPEQLKVLKAPDLSSGTVEYKNPMVLKGNTVISGNDSTQKSKIQFKWLTVFGNNSTVVLENLDIACKIQCVAGATIIFRNCHINKLDNNMALGDNEITVEVFVGSNCVFEDCQIEASHLGYAVIVRDRSNSTFNGCSFSNVKSGVIVSRGSFTKMLNCDFSDCTDFGVYAFGTSKACLEKCKFSSCGKNGILVVEDSKLECEGCIFQNCNCGIIVGKSLEVTVLNCRFNNIKNIGIGFKAESKGLVKGCMFNDILGNSVNFDYSTGEVQQCLFNRCFKRAVIIAIGHSSNPLISDCSMAKNMSNSMISVRDGASPRFVNMKISDFDKTSPIISCSDFSNTEFDGIDIDTTTCEPEIIVFNEAKVKFSFHGPCRVICSKENGQVQEYVFGDNPSGHSILATEKIKGQISFEGKCDVIDHESVELDHVDDCICQDSVCDYFVNCPCGHPVKKCPKCEEETLVVSKGKVECSNCGKIDFSDPHFKCETCKTKLDCISKVVSEDTCSICLDEKSDTIFLPCGHKCVCYECAKLIFEKEKRMCPICRKHALSFKLDFFY